ncbi:DUF2382 domain-containing protein [Chamaesiphon sp. VAR_48_metabat_135_sub]|uniref:DUF2382 domain-containing protein n=1 Tax=Chamaesiphon sp. VAR_48_metabat_135_sub TaxID=2964699 RepID=UPI00286C7B4F|nr:DUF2382 domain-containing protein [Chamaesiphon sp. VAR_48_metabat_135_sub]
MSLYKIKDFDPDYNSHSDDPDIKGLSMYAGTEEIGSINDVLVDGEGKFRYLVVDTGGWIMGKKVLLPIGHARIDYKGKRVYADNLTKAQVEALPEFTSDMLMDYDQEEQVRGVYRSTQPAANGVGYAGAMSAPATVNSPPTLDLEAGYAGYDRDTYGYEQEPELYSLNEENHPNLKLYEERLIASKNRQKTGETVISKRVETETANASVAVEKERVIVERIPVNSGTVVTPGEANFQAGEVARMDVYEEVPEFHKEAFVREEVRVSKVVDQETATAQEQLRREELDVDTEGRPVVNNI